MGPSLSWTYLFYTLFFPQSIYLALNLSLFDTCPHFYNINGTSFKNGQNRSHLVFPNPFLSIFNDCSVTCNISQPMCRLFLSFVYVCNNVVMQQISLADIKVMTSLMMSLIFWLVNIKVMTSSLMHQLSLLVDIKGHDLTSSIYERNSIYKICQAYFFEHHVNWSLHFWNMTTWMLCTVKWCACISNVLLFSHDLIFCHFFSFFCRHFLSDYLWKMWPSECVYCPITQNCDNFHL